MVRRGGKKYILTVHGRSSKERSPHDKAMQTLKGAAAKTISYRYFEFWTEHHIKYITEPDSLIGFDQIRGAVRISWLGLGTQTFHSEYVILCTPSIDLEPEETFIDTVSWVGLVAGRFHQGEYVALDTSQRGVSCVVPMVPWDRGYNFK